MSIEVLAEVHVRRPREQVAAYMSDPANDPEWIGGLRQRPTLIDNAPGQQAALVQTESGVSVEIHPASSLGLGCLAAPSLQGGPDEPT
jgi:hypothetical protein